MSFMMDTISFGGPMLFVANHSSPCGTDLKAFLRSNHTRWRGLHLLCALMDLTMKECSRQAQSPSERERSHPLWLPTLPASLPKLRHRSCCREMGLQLLGNPSSPFLRWCHFDLSSKQKEFFAPSCRSKISTLGRCSLDPLPSTLCMVHVSGPVWAGWHLPQLSMSLYQDGHTESHLGGFSGYFKQSFNHSGGLSVSISTVEYLLLKIVCWNVTSMIVWAIYLAAAFATACTSGPLYPPSDDSKP